MKKIFFLIASSCLLSIFFIPVLISAAGLVPCNGPDCTIGSFFQLLANIYTFIVTMIAAPLATISLIVGGILMMASAGNPGMFSKGTEIVKWSIIGLVLVFGSYVIIDFILKTVLGSTINWSNPF